MNHVFRNISVRPLTRPIGAEINEIDLIDSDDESYAEIRRALLDHRDCKVNKGPFS